MNGSRLTALVAASALTMAIGACSQGAPNEGTSRPSAHIAGSGKVYTDVAALGADSDLIVRGKVTEQAGTALDDGGLGPGTGGIPMVFYTVKVAESGPKGAAPPSLTLAYIDLTKVEGDEVAPLTVGQEYVFFLLERSAASAPGVRAWTPLYVPTAGSFGVFHIGQDGRAQAYQPELSRLRASGSIGERVHGRLIVRPNDLLSMK